MNKTEKLYIPVLLGTNRSGRNSENVAKYILEETQKNKNIETELFDVKDFKFFKDDYGESEKEANQKWEEAVVRADGLIIVSPEYNHSFPGVLKEALDLLFKEYKHKAVGIAGVSSGPWGGARMVENIIPVLYELGLVAVQPPLYFGNVGSLFSEEGKIADEAYNKRVGNFLDSLVWMARALKWGRENMD